MKDIEHPIDDTMVAIPKPPCLEGWPDFVGRCLEGTQRCNDCTHLLDGGSWADCGSGGLADRAIGEAMRAAAEERRRYG